MPYTDPTTGQPQYWPWEQQPAQAMMMPAVAPTAIMVQQPTVPTPTGMTTDASTGNLLQSKYSTHPMAAHIGGYFLQQLQAKHPVAAAIAHVASKGAS